MEQSIDISLYLPHRDPMLMVDTITHLSNEYVKTVFEIKPSNIFMENGVLAASGLVENAAQTCSSIVAKDYFFDENGNPSGNEVIGFISAIKSIKILSLPDVGSTIECRCTLVSAFTAENYTLCTMACTTFCNGKELLQGEINLYITKIEKSS